MWKQEKIQLSPRSRGFYLITREIEQGIDLSQCKTGILHIFIQHSSASLTINENADPTVRTDFESHFNVMVPENAPYYLHTYEGPDDMPSHIKMALTRTAEVIPFVNGRLCLGTWQGVFLWEHRARSHQRRVVLSFQGD